MVLVLFAGCLLGDPGAPPKKATTTTVKAEKDQLNDARIIQRCKDNWARFYRFSTEPAYQDPALLDDDAVGSLCKAIKDNDMKACLGAIGDATLSAEGRDSFCELVTGDVRDCEAHVDAGMRGSCVMTRSLFISDGGECDRLKSRLAQSQCKNIFAMASQDLSHCDNEPEADLCRFNFALFLEDPVQCNRILDEKTANLCWLEFAAKSNETDYCEPMTSVHRTGCYSAVALRLREPRICQGLEEQVERDGCINAYARFAADPGACELASTEAAKDCAAFFEDKSLE